MLSEKTSKPKKMSKKRVPPIFRLTMKPGSNIELVYNHPQLKKIVLDELVKAIKEGIEHKSKSINLFQVGDSEFHLEIIRKDWKISLSTALVYFSDEEDYPKCIEIRDMIKTL